MTAPVITHPRPFGDCRAMAGRSLRRALRSPDSLITAVALPVFILLLFVYVFGGAIHTGTTYLNYVVPGIILLSAAWGAAQTAVSVCADMVEGIVDRFRALPISPASVLTGHVIAMTVRNLMSTGIVIAISVAMGFRPNAAAVEWTAAIGMISLFVLAMSWVCAALGLVAGSPEAAGGFTFSLLFLPYVSSAFVPVSSMPSWLRGFADHQPVTPIIETVRGLLTGAPIGSSAWAAGAWCAGIAAAGYSASRWLFARRSAR